MLLGTREEEKLLTTRDGARQLFANLPRGSYQQTLLDMFTFFFFSTEFTHAIGLRSDRTSAYQVKADNMLTRALWALLLAAIGQLATFNAMHYVFPLVLIRSVDDDREPRSRYGGGTSIAFRRLIFARAFGQSRGPFCFCPEHLPPERYMWYAPSVWLSIRLSEFKQYLSPLVNACAPSVNLKNAVCEGRSVSRLSLRLSAGVGA